MKVFLNGKIVEDEQAVVSVNDRGLLFGDGVYEVIRLYDGVPFHMGLHLERLQRCLNELSIEYKNVFHLEEVANKLIQENGVVEGQGLVYIQITRGSSPLRSHLYSTSEYAPFCFIKTSNYVQDKKNILEGIGVVATPDMRWHRCDLKTTCLLPNTMAAEIARQKNCKEALLVRDGVITEGTKCNFFGIKDSVVYTHPKTNHILPGITREVVIEILKKNGIPIKEFPVFESEKYSLDEAFICGTATDITPVVSIDNKNIRNGFPGEITMRIQDFFQEYVNESIKNHK